jgi:hypothetical protein
MTTSWSYFIRGQILSSLRANSGGTLLAMIASVSAPWLLAAGVKGRWLGRAGLPVVVLISVSVVVVVLIDWAVRSW